MNSPPGGIVTFLFTDIEGSTRLWEQHAEAMQPILARHDAILRSSVLAHGGYVVKMRGDGIHAAFSSAPAALNATVAAQRALQGADWGEIGALKVRAALHTADVQWSDGDYYGAQVNRAARLLSAGYGGQMLLSQATRDRLCDDLPDGVSLRDLGLHRLKDLVQPERVFQVVAPDLHAEFPPLITLSTLPNVLPIQLTPFIGRAKEVAEGAALLRRRDVRLLTLTGPGGTGKTRLGLQIVADVLDGFCDGVYFVDLSVVRDPALVPLAIARVLNIPDIGGVDTMTSLMSYLREKQLLLVLDNCEQVVAAAPLVSKLLTAADGLKVLATSRVRLRLVMEHTYAVPALALPDLRKLPPLPVFSTCEAVELFVERSLAAKPAFAITDASAPAVAQICVRLDGLPLAIELAAAHSRQMTPQALLKHLELGMGLLTGGARDLPTRQQTMKATIGWSYALLKEAEQEVLRRLGVFVGGWTLEAAAAVCGRDVGEELRSLAEQSLIRQHEEADGTQRFTMLETVRAYALERLERAGEAEEAREGHAAYFAGFAEEADARIFFTSGDFSWLDRTQIEADNFRAVFHWAEASDRAEAALRILAATTIWTTNRGFFLEWLRWYERLIALPSALAPTLARGRALREMGQLVLSGGGQLERPAQFLEESIALCHSLGATGDAIMAMALRGWVICHTDLQRGKALIAEAMALSSTVDWPRLHAWMKGMDAAPILTWEPDCSAAGPIIEAGLAFAREHGYRLGESGQLDMLAQYTMRHLKDPALARRYYNEAKAIAGAMGGSAMFDRGHAIAVGETYMAEGRFAEAEVMYQEAYGKMRELGDTFRSAELLAFVGRAALMQNKLARAKSALEQSLAWIEGRDCWWVHRIDLEGLIEVAYRNGDRDEERRRLREHFTILRYHWLHIPSAILALAHGLDVLAALDAHRAAQILGAITGLAGSARMSLTPLMEQRRVAATSAVQQRLGDQAFQAALAEGLAMTREQALDCALDVLRQA